MSGGIGDGEAPGGATTASARDFTADAEEAGALAHDATADADGAHADGAATMPGARAVARRSSGLRRYQLGDELGRGGIGVVREAVDEQLGRTVAVKQLLVAAPSTRVRFEREARITARLEHPGVVPVYDQGHTPTGEPFYVMRKVGGHSLADELSARGSLAERLGLVPIVLAVADTMAYAHGQRVIHRDLKPSNVLVGDHGEALVIDWGLAKDLAAGDDDDGFGGGEAGDGLTAHGAVVGTPAYMPPEQARGLALDERADVYALGALLYAVLTGGAPFRGTLQAILDAVVAGPPPAVATRAPEAPRELIAIVERAMARRAGDRYASASELADDLRAFQTGQLVSAFHYGVRARARRWLRRHRLTVVVASLLSTALAVLAVTSVVGIARERDRATLALASLEQRDSELALGHAEALLDSDPTAAVAWIKHARPAPDQMWRARALAETAASRGVAHDVLALDGLGLYVAVDGAHALIGDEAGSVWAWDGARLTAIARRRPGPRALAVRGGRAVIADRSGAVQAIELATGAATPLGTTGPAGACAIDAGGDAWCADAAGLLERWHGARGEAIARLGGAAAMLVLADDDTWAAGLEDGTLVVGTAAGASWRARAHTREVGRIAFVGDHGLITAGDDGDVVRWDLRTHAPQTIGRHDDWVAALVVSPDGQWIATGSGDSTIRLWGADGRVGPVLRGHTGAVWSLAWAPDGRLASASADGAVRLWTIDDRGGASVALGVGGVARRVAWVRGALIATVGATLRVWTALPPVPRPLAGDLGTITTMAWSPRGTYLAAGGHGQRAIAWDVARGVAAIDQRLGGWITDLRFTGDDRLIVTGEHEAVAVSPGAAAAGIVTGTGTQLGTPLHDGARVAWIDDTSTSVTVRGFDGTATALAAGHHVLDYDVAPDDGAILTGDRERTVAIWPIGGGPARLLGHLDAPPQLVAFSPRGTWAIAVPQDQGAAWAWQLHADGPGRALPAAEDAADPLAITDDDVLVAAVDDGIAVIELATGATRILRGHRARPDAVALSPDGALAITTDGGGELRVWRLRDGAGAVVGGRFSRIAPALLGGGQIAAVSADGAVELLPIPALALHAEGELPGWLEQLTTAVLAGDQGPRTPR